MSDIDSEFFRGKRPWSKIKDKVLGGYMPAYLRKVAKLGRPILLIDGYAGPGTFDDKTPGSPLIMCSLAEKHVPAKYKALFVNHNKQHHEKLDTILKHRGLHPNAVALHGDSSAFLNALSISLKDQTVFVYLDPFGLKGCEFETLIPFLTRNNSYSTELVINVSMPITHRLASVNAVQKSGTLDTRIASFHKRMTEVFGGDYWKDIYFSTMTAEEKEFALIREYQALIANYLPYTGSCPVRENTSSRIKYFITFASRHIDAMLLMNDEMCKAYFGEMHKADWAGTLFAKTDWKSFRTPDELDSLVLTFLAKNPRTKRKSLWTIIVQNHFMQYTSSEYRKSISRLVKNSQIEVIYTSTGRLNDDCLLSTVK